MNRADYDRIRKQIDDDYKRKVDALNVLFDVNESAPKERIQKDRPIPSAPREPKNMDPGAACEMPDCGKKLRSDSKKCDDCGKRICSKHYDYSKLMCTECAART